MMMILTTHQKWGEDTKRRIIKEGEFNLKTAEDFKEFEDFKATSFEVLKMDVKTAFLNDILKEEVYISHPEDFVNLEKPNHVYILYKAFYGLKQPPRAWSDIMFSTCLCARYQASPKESHLSTVKHIFKYLKGIVDLGLWYPKDTVSSSQHIQMLDRKTEAEYVTSTSCCSQVLWMRTQLRVYGFKFDKIPIYYDSKSAIAISANPVQHTKTKHIDVRYHFYKDNVEKGTIELYFVNIYYHLVDLFTKPLDEKRFNFLISKLGMLNLKT
ncbi:hypothetical protein L6452_36308 [Arctium lappa]|uniref:Uncharacterized protein n=1 Tax=Arctium lappa TaxID=4217 RepID=A0ACB8Y9F9_ARCLA|nr:hypothetical protein L6452_36308 [Arctium lappa]